MPRQRLVNSPRRQSRFGHEPRHFIQVIGDVATLAAKLRPSLQHVLNQAVSVVVVGYLGVFPMYQGVFSL